MSLHSHAILHVDMDAFYASIEQRDCPEYRGKPVIVGADPQGGRGRGVVSAASYEARPFGIHSAMPIRQAYQRCPHGIFLPVRMERYAEVSERIFAIFHQYTEFVEPLSLDEAFLDVTGSRQLFGSAEQIGLTIQREILSRERLSASVGIATNKFLAKVASDLRKPRGFVIVAAGQEADFLRALPVTRLWGAGPKTTKQLHRLGCRTIGDVARQSKAQMHALLGRHGIDLWELAQGIDPRPVVPEEPAQSIGAETTFDRDTNDPRVIRRTLLALAERVAQRLRQGNLHANRLTLKYRDATFRTVTRATSLGDSTDQAAVLYRVALSLITRIPSSENKVRLLGLTASKLSPSIHSGRQLWLFDRSEEKETQLSTVLDSIHAKFGPQAIRRASLLDKAS